MLSSVDGRIAPAEEATISIMDEGLLRGDGGFEVLRLYEGRPFALAEHLARLGRTCEGIRLEVDLEALKAETEALLQEAGPFDALLRWVVTRGGRRLAIVEPLPERLETLRVMTVEYSTTGVLDRLKTLSYGANMLAVRLARAGGYDEALFVTPGGQVLEGSTWTFFWVEGGQLRTPSLDAPILDSITRRFVLEECGGEEATCTQEDLVRAEEAFLASTVREVTPIVLVDDREIPTGPVTAQARERLAARIGRELAVEAAA